MDPQRKVNVNLNSSGYLLHDSTSLSISPSSSNASGTSGMTRSLDMATKNAADTSTIGWVGSVDGPTLFNSMNRASLVSCGLSLHSPYITRGLIELDKDLELLLSPLIVGNNSPHVRGLSKNFVRTPSDRRALAQACGVSQNSSYFVAVFGDSAEHSSASILEFERLLAAQLGGFGKGLGAEDSAFELKNLPRGERLRGDAMSASPGDFENGPLRLRGRDLFYSSGYGAVGEGGDLPFLPAGAEDVEGGRRKDEAFLHSAWARLTSQYGSPKIGLLVLRRVSKYLLK